eukprot:12226675-Prorocentrum_lima.AAC.1
MTSSLVGSEMCIRDSRKDVEEGCLCMLWIPMPFLLDSSIHGYIGSSGSAPLCGNAGSRSNRH